MMRRSLLASLGDRRVTSWVRNRLLDRWLPPVARDLRPLNRAANRLWLGRVPLDFQREAWTYGPEQWRAVWSAIDTSASRARPSDTSERETAWLCERIRALAPATVLEIGASRGHVAARLFEAMPAGGTLYLQDAYVDVPLPPVSADKVARRIRDDVTRLPFPDGAIDMVVCAHTLEHLTRLYSTFQELRRVARRVLVIVPLQRWAPYTWDLHLHFFPYLEYLPGLLETPARTQQVIDGDGCYEFPGLIDDGR